MSKARILHVIDHLGPGGAQEILLNILRHLDSSSFEQEVVALHGRNACYINVLEKRGIVVHCLAKSKFDPLILPRLWRVLRRNQYQIVHAHLIASNLLAKPLAALAGVPFRFNYDHANDPNRERQRLLLYLDTLANRWCHHIVAVSTSIQTFLVKHEHIDPKRISVILNSVDIKEYVPAPERRQQCRRQWDLPDDAVVIAGVGRLRDQKNYPLFLKVAANLLVEEPDVRFLIAGNGPNEKALHDLAHELGLGDRVRFIGYVHDMSQVYPAVDIFFMPSHFEGTPVAGLEAMAMNLPLVASRVDGLMEIIDEGVNGLLVTPGDEEEFTTVLLDLCRRPEERERLGSEARRTVSTHFTAGQMVEKVDAIYRQYLDDPDHGCVQPDQC